MNTSWKVVALRGCEIPGAVASLAMGGDFRRSTRRGQGARTPVAARQQALGNCSSLAGAGPGGPLLLDGRTERQDAVIALDHLDEDVPAALVLGYDRGVSVAQRGRASLAADERAVELNPRPLVRVLDHVEAQHAEFMNRGPEDVPRPLAEGRRERDPDREAVARVLARIP